MDEVDKWREWFLHQYGEVRDAFVTFNEANTHLLSIFLSANFKPGFDTHSGGIFIDLGFHNENRAVSAVGATFSKNAAALYVSRSLIVFSHEKDENTGTLLFSGEKNFLSESTDGLFKYEISENTFRLIDLSATLSFWSQREKSYAPVKQWDLEDFKSEEFEVLCSGCFGEGASKRMSIPKVDYESGLSGYDLYSCNKINGTYGCKECGGSGAQYEQWYLAENPSLRNESENFRLGWGEIPQGNITEVHIRVPDR